jgi:acetyl-CoA carboxylase biotin carboxyl carrier protein
MDLRKLKALVDLVSESSITELEITEAEGKVRIVKASPVAMVPTAPAVHVVAAPATSSESSSAAVAPASAAPSSAPAAPPDAGRMIKSPMVGTFYRSASPGAKSFVDVGSVVKPGEPVCIIEAMKIMNEIEADIGGTIVRILCENGQAVEYGQPLFVVE